MTIAHENVLNKIYELYNWNSYKVHSCQALHLRKNILKMHLSFDCERFIFFYGWAKSIQYFELWSECTYVAVLQRYKSIMCEEKGKLGRSCIPLLLKVLSDNDLQRGYFPFNLAIATHYFYRLIFSCFRQTTSTDRVMTIICAPIC